MTKLALFLLVLSAGCFRKSDRDAAERSASRFAASLPGATGQIECLSRDTDGDGYCGCTAFMKDGTTTSLDCGCSGDPMGCGESGDIPDGCKVIENFRAQQVAR